MLMFIQLIGLPNSSLLQQGKRTHLFFGFTFHLIFIRISFFFNLDNDGKVKIFSKRFNERKSRPNELMKKVSQRTDQDFVNFLLQCLQFVN